MMQSLGCCLKTPRPPGDHDHPALIRLAPEFKLATHLPNELPDTPPCLPCQAAGLACIGGFPTEIFSVSRAAPPLPSPARYPDPSLSNTGDCDRSSHRIRA